MLERILFAGFGGQGVLLAGKVLAYAGMLAGKDVSWMPSYGPEMRGGTANCAVTISNKKIASPIVDEPDSALIYNKPSLEKYLLSVKQNGLILINSSLVEKREISRDVSCVWLDIHKIADSVGSRKVANMVLLGAYLKAKNLIDWEIACEAIKKVFEDKNDYLVQLNLSALEEGGKSYESR